MKRWLALVACMWGAATMAQDATDRRAQRFAKDDANQDGKLSREEFSGPAAIFTRLDRDGDGVVTREEMLGRQQRGEGGQARPMRLPDGWAVKRGVEYARRGDLSLTLDIVLPDVAPERPLPVVVFVHGGGWRSGDSAQSLRKVVPLAQHGFIGVSINYRLSQQAIFPAQIQDCQDALRFLRENAAAYHLDPARIGVWGSSAGGHLVALLGTSAGAPDLMPAGLDDPAAVRVQCVVDFYGPADLLAMVDQPSQKDHGAADSAESLLLGGPVKERPDAARLASPITYVSADDPPFLIVHGTADMTVPIQQSEALHAALVAAGVDSTYVPLDGAGHGGPQFATPELSQQILAFFQKHLAPVE